MEHARRILNTFELDNGFLEVINTTTYIINRSPTTMLDGKTSEEFLCGKLVDYSHFHIFGCDAFSHVPKENMSNLAP